MVDKLTDAELDERIRLVLKQVIPKGVSPGNISPETRLVEDLNIDSVHAVDLVFNLEDAFGISIDDGLIDTLQTVGDVVSLVKEKIA
jgi:acyl carrier protein